MKSLIVLIIVSVLSGCASYQMDQRDQEKLVKVLLKRYN